MLAVSAENERQSYFVFVFGNFRNENVARQPGRSRFQSIANDSFTQIDPIRFEAMQSTEPTVQHTNAHNPFHETARD